MIKHCLIFFILTFSGFTKASQQNISEDSLTFPHVVWLKQFQNEINNLKFSEKLSNIILGKKNDISLSKPISIIALNIDSLIVLDQGNSQIFEINNKIVPLKSVIKKNVLKFESLVGICSNQENDYYFTDSKLNKVFEYNSKNKSFRIINDSLILNQPTGIAYSNVDNNIWVVETASHRLTILKEDGTLIKHIGKRGNGDSEFNFPTNLCIADDGNIYVVDAMNFRIQILDKNGEFLSTFGSVGDASGYFARPKGIALDTFGNIYISDALFHVVQVFDTKGNFLYRHLLFYFAL